MSEEHPVLVGYVADLAGHEALQVGAVEARLRNTSLTVMHQLVGIEVPDRYGQIDRHADQRKAVADDLRRKARDAAPDIERVDLSVVTGAIADELIIASKDACLVVLGVTTKHPIAAAAFGTVPHDVVRRAHCPVLLVPADCDVWQGAPIVCGVDRSTTSLDALQWAVAEASRRGCVVRAVEITRQHLASETAGVKADSLQDWVAEHLPQSATTVICTTEVAHAAHRLLEITKEVHGLLVIGAHRRSRWRTTSVARVVTSQTHVPVVVVQSQRTLQASYS